MSDRRPIRQQVTFVPVVDLDRSARFYGEILGLRMVLDQGPCRIYHVAGDAFLGTCNHGGPEAVKPGAVTLTLVSDDVDGWHARLTAAGVDLDGPVRHNPRFNITHFYATDPDGHSVEIQAFHDPAWPAPTS